MDSADGAFVSVDPGDRHTGVTWFEQDATQVGGWKCRSWSILTPEQVYETLMPDIQREQPAVVVLERWQLYPQAAGSQIGKDMLASQLIGALSWQAYRFGIPVEVQQAAVKVPVRARLRQMGIKLTAPSKPDHARDAEIHGWAYLIRKGLTT